MVPCLAAVAKSDALARRRQKAKPCLIENSSTKYEIGKEKFGGE